ncbi:MAG: hypothetical protein ACTSO7_04770 [Candidatus Heimdallarchaeota archaeon]
MLISLATMDFRLCHLLREKLTQGGIKCEQISPGDKPTKRSILVVTIEREEKVNPTNYPKKVVLSNSETLNINRAHAKIILGIEGKKVWESLIIGVDPGLSIGVALVTDGCLRSTLETRDIREAVKFVIESINNTPSKMTIIRMGSTGGYRRVLLLNELLNVKPGNVTLEIVDELMTTPQNYQDALSVLEEVKRDGVKVHVGKDATAAMKIAFRLGEKVSCTESLEVSDGELKEIQVLSRQYSSGDVTITKDLAEKVACGLLTIEGAIKMHKDSLHNNKS